jgi:hypothetical protein
VEWDARGGMEPRAVSGAARGLRRRQRQSGSIAHGIATSPGDRELAEGLRAVALPLVVMDLLGFAELLVTAKTLRGGRT